MSLLKEVRSDNTPKILELLQGKPDLSVTDKNGNNLLHLAILNQNEVVLKQLLAANDGSLNINACNEDGIPAISLCISQNFADGVDALINAGADINVLSEEGSLTPLHFCAKFNNLEAAKTLLRKKVDPNITSSTGSPLCIATYHNNDEVAFKLLDTPDIDLTLTDSDSNTFLHIAVLQSATNVLQKFLLEDVEKFKEQGVDIAALLNTQNKDGNTILHLAELLEKTTFSSFFKQKAVPLGLDVNIRNNKGKTAEQCKAEVIENKKALEEKKKLEKEEAKEAKKNKKILREQLEEDRRAHEAAEAERNQRRIESAKKAMEQTQKYGPYVIVVIVILSLVAVYFFFEHAIQKKKDNILDL